MQFMQIGERVVSYRLIGTQQKPLVVMAHPLGMNQSVWDEIIHDLLPDFQILTWDLPGHGLSSPWLPGENALTPTDLVNDLSVLTEMTGKSKFHFVGTSIGGVIGQEILSSFPNRLLSVVLTNTGATIGTPENWTARADRVLKEGLEAVSGEIVPRWFAERSLQTNPSLKSAWQHQMEAGDAGTYAALCWMLAKVDYRGKFEGVIVPTTLIGGENDVATPPSTIEALARELREVPPIVLSGIGHVPSIEAPAHFGQLLKNHLLCASRVGDSGEVSYTQGLKTRKSILGLEHVEKASQNQTSLDAPFQKMITRLAWGELWGNTDLSRQERSLITIALLAALGRDGELELHLKTAKTIPLSEKQLRQALMHVAIYAGVPAANHAFSMAKKLGWGESLQTSD